MTTSIGLHVALSLLQLAAPSPLVSLELACGQQSSELALTIRNTGTVDTSVRLGIVLANGAWYQPRDLTVEMTRAGGREPETLMYGGLRDIGGRIDHWIVGLPARALFALTLRSSDFISTTQPTPAAAPESVVVRLDARPITDDLNMDVRGMKDWKVWTGTVRSNQVRLSDCAPRR